MATPFLGEVKLIAFNFAPQGWAFCNGQVLSIQQNQALFAILGTTYGGNGQTTYGLPNLQGRVPLHVGNGRNLGERAGEESHTLIASEMPAHIHPVMGTTVAGDTNNPVANFFAQSSPQSFLAYSSQQGNTTLDPGTITAVGGSQPHSNMQPYLVLNFIIALQGIFPSQN